MNGTMFEFHSDRFDIFLSSFCFLLSAIVNIIEKFKMEKLIKKVMMSVWGGGGGG